MVDILRISRLAVLTCSSYCNSIMQALYYSIPFRENVVRYPPHSPNDTPNGQPTIVVPIRAAVPNGAVSPPPKAKGLTAKEAMERRKAINNGQPVSPQPGQRPEDKPDSPEYKKKHAMIAGPILELTYENASSYGMEESTFTAMKDIFMALIANPARSGVLSPQRFLEIFKRDNEMFRTSMHQDAHEFYGLVLNAVITNVEANADKMRLLEAHGSEEERLGLGERSALTKAVKAVGHAGGARSPSTGWVHDIFEGVLTSETKCLTCETASQRDETFLDLSIDLEEHSSVTSCLQKFSAEEMLCQKNKFHCDNCGGLQEAEKRMKIKRLPKILTLHLKRFKYNEEMTRLNKLFHRVVYPYHLRLFTTTDDAEDPDRLYELYAVVVHIGSNAFHGHYVSVIKTQDRGWLLFDDEMVEPVDKHYVRNFFGDKPGQACAYVLFYQETTAEAMRHEQEAEGAAEVALATAEAGVALGHPQPSGTHPASISKQVTAPNTPIDGHQDFVSLNNVISAPLPTSLHSEGAPLETPLLHKTTPLNKTAKQTKEERALEQKAVKEVEKARKAADKAAEKEKIKQAEQRRKELEIQRRNQEEDVKRALALSKQTAAKDEAKRKQEASASQMTSTISFASSEDLNGTPAPPPKDKPFGLSMGSLSRSGRGSKSISRKSFGSFLNKDKDKFKENDDHTAVDGQAGPQTPEKHEKPAKDGSRTSFGFGKLGRKSSNLEFMSK